MEGEVLSLAALHIISVSNVSGVTHRCVTKLFYRLFYHMERLDLLNPVNEVHIFALHYVYIPCVNKSLQEFKNGWNHHQIRTETILFINCLLKEHFHCKDSSSCLF